MRLSDLRAAGLVGLLACVAPAVAWEVIDTGLAPRPQVLSSNAYWIDERRVVFPAHSEGIGPAVIVWDAGTRRATVHSEIGEYREFCYAGGYVRYGVDRLGKRYVREGRFGAEQESEHAEGAPGSKLDVNPLTCRVFDYATTDQVYPGFNFVPLRERHGHYGWSNDPNEDAPKYFLPPVPRPKPVPLPVRAHEERRMTYSEYAGAYVIERSELTRRVRESVPSGKAWLLFPSGRVSEMEFPAGPWMQATWGYAPTRKGWVVSSRVLGTKPQEEVGHAGLYIVADGRADRIIAGFPGAPEVSPDGCKVALVVDRLVRPARGTLHVVDLCN